MKKQVNLTERFLKLYNELSPVLQEAMITESEVSIYNLRRLFNTILVNTKTKETKQTLKDMLKVLTKMELGSIPMPNLRKVSDKTVEL